MCAVSVVYLGVAQTSAQSSALATRYGSASVPLPFNASGSTSLLISSNSAISFSSSSESATCCSSVRSS